MSMRNGVNYLYECPQIGCKRRATEVVRRNVEGIHDLNACKVHVKECIALEGLRVEVSDTISKGEQTVSDIYFLAMIFTVFFLHYC